MIEDQRGRGTLVEIRAAIKRDSDGNYWAEVEQLPGCFASGESISELLEGLTEAVGLYLAGPGAEPPPVAQFASVSMTVSA